VLTALALAFAGLLARRLCATVPRQTRLAAICVVAAALLCAGEGLLGALSTRVRSPIDLVFLDALGQKVRAHDDRVTTGRVTPGRLCLVMALGALGGALAVRARPVRRGRKRGRPRGVVLLGLLALPYALTFYGALASPARGFDALWYHLPLAAAFRAHAHLEPPGRDLVFYFPGNGELLAGALVEMLGPRALPLVQWPFALLSAHAAYAVARAVGARRAWAAAGLVLAAPVVLFQSQLAYVDLVALAAVTTSAALLTAAVRALSLRTAVARATLAGLALGLAVGAKFAALPLTAALVPVLGLTALAPNGRVSLRAAPRAAALVGACLAATLVPSLFFYARNLRLTGNPLFPIAVPSLGLPGLFLSDAFNRGKELEFVSSRAAWAVYPFIEKTSHESGFGAGFACLVPLATVVLFAALVARLWRGRVPSYALPLGWGLSYLPLWWWFTPHEVRHLLPVVALLGAPACLLLSVPDRGRTLCHAVACGLAFSALTTARALLYSPVAEHSVRASSRAALYDLPPELEHAIPDGARVANLAGRPYNFPLLGERLKVSLIDFAGGQSDETLVDRGAEYVFYRGSPKALRPTARWRELHRSPAQNHRWWEATDGDQVALYAFTR
jgi:hypothetical protein